MRKYTVIQSFLMITSVLASVPFHVIRREGGILALITSTTSAQTTAVQSSPASLSPTSAPSAVTTTTGSSSPPLSLSTPSTSAAPSSTSAISTQTTSSPTSSATSVASTPSSPLTTSSSIQETTSASTSTDAQGSPITIVTTISASSTTSSPSTSATGTPQDNTSHSGTIIGLSVAGGVAAFGIIAFIIWKLTRKRFSDLDDADEAIKWPELNRDTHTDLGNDGLSPQISNTYSADALSRNPSTFDHTEHDPYAVPPLPQFNPNQPYRDDPRAASNAGYYDPYRGPIPQTLHDGSVDGHENIPMSTYPPGSRTRSPGPGMAYDMGGRGSPASGRASPALGPAYDIGVRGSPAPGRTISPGPATALGLDKRPTYDVQYSGPPEMALRSRTPGSNVLE